MDERILKLFDILNFDSEIKEQVVFNMNNNYEKINEDSLIAYDGEGFDFNVCKKSDFYKLCIILNLLPKFYDKYKKIGVDDNVIIDTLKDISLRANLYYQKYNKPGLTEDDVIWFRHINNTNVFKIGCLQFQPFKMIYLDKETIGENYMIFDDSIKNSLPCGSPVINCHIQFGADLTKEGIDISFIEAKRFFSNICKADYIGFLCYSWLLYPKMNKLLKENSNIKYLYNKFNIIGQCQDLKQAKENIFPQGKLFDLFKKNSNNFGYACGVIFF